MLSPVNFKNEIQQNIHNSPFSATLLLVMYLIVSQFDKHVLKIA